MEPTIVTTSTSVLNKIDKHPAMPPVFEETKEAPSSTIRFLRDYIPLRKLSVAHAHLKKKAMYLLVELTIPEGFII
jgi:hypothetical protein